MPLVYPPHSLALGSIYVASLLLSIDEHQPPPQTPASVQSQQPQPQSHAAPSSSHPPPQPIPPDTSTTDSISTQPSTISPSKPSQSPHPAQPESSSSSDVPEEITPGDLARLLNERLDWEDTYQTRVEDLEDFAHTLLDLVHLHTLNPSANTSPSTPSSPSPHLSKSTSSVSGLRAAVAAANSIGGDPYPYKSDALLNLKIAMRNREHAPRSRRGLGEDLIEDFGPPGSNFFMLSGTPLPSASGATFGSIPTPASASSGKDARSAQEKAAKQDETTIRYLFFPPGYDADGDVVMGNIEDRSNKSKRRER